jgi:quercetin dioxygenase-like cupin family protein
MTAHGAAKAVAQRIMSPFMIREIVETALPDDERVWVPQGEDAWFRPLMLDTVHNVTINVLRTRSKGVVSRHYHTSLVYGYVIRGAWRYLEHDWIATEGSFVMEPAGEVHTLVLDGLSEEMITLFVVHGALIHIDEHGKPTHFADCFQKIAMCDAHYRAVGLGPDYIRRFVR